ncbi:albusnodin family lasso peptide [Streptomyces sp. 130]|nr:albusnodin family lasso peptide [Streptomyces sp. 130]TRV75611.1 albusnodin family lasso peptide [Streptomyces sp. 130]
MSDTSIETASTEDEATTIDLGDAAELTKGNTSSSVENKQTPYCG